jgi:hypothetical protein
MSVMRLRRRETSEAHPKTTLLKREVNIVRSRKRVQQQALEFARKAGDAMVRMTLFMA